MREPTTDPPREWARGDVCKLTFAGQSVKASVMMAGKRGCSLMLIFSEVLGGYVGAMAVLWYSREAEFRDLITWQTVTIEPLESPDDEAKNDRAK